MDNIIIKGAKIHNLKNISLSIPKHKLVVITGISGSGKSSLGFDIIFEEGKNQYLRSIGILSGLDNDDRFDSIEGIGPAVAIRQNTVRQSNPRSTVGSKTSLLNQLAMIYTGECRDEDRSMRDFLYTTSDGMCINCQGRGSYYDVNLQSLIPDKDTTLSEVYDSLKVTSGFLGVLRRKFGQYFNTPFWDIEEDIREELVYGTFDNGKQSYCIERILKNAFDRGEDVAWVYDKTVCPECNGERVSSEANEILFHGKRIGELGLMTIHQLYDFLMSNEQMSDTQFTKNTIKSICEKLNHLINFRLGHLTLYREMSSLSGGELQRIFLHMHLESKLDSLIYVFDEPMAGLHPSEKQSMIKAVEQLRDLGNTVIVVEHDKDMIRHADQIIEIGPKAGVEGGTVVFQGDYEAYKKADTLAGRFITNVPDNKFVRRKDLTTNVSTGSNSLVIEHADIHYLNDLTATIPLHAMVGVAGLSGSGKSSLITETLMKRLASYKKYGKVYGLSGACNINGSVLISQEPIGRSASSTPATYIGIWDRIRNLFADQPEAVDNNMSAGNFSFHSKGACPECSGSGYERIFLTADFSIDRVCPRCNGRRFNEETLKIKYRDKTVSDILNMSIDEACKFFDHYKNISGPLSILKRLGMGYLTLGQPTASLSGGEAQRVKLAKVLGKKHGNNILYVLDEPTTGLGMYDISLLVRVLKQLVDNGNSVIVIEHNTEVLELCDYLIEMGPEGGDRGGQIIACGTPEQLKNNEKSITGRFLS